MKRFIALLLVVLMFGLLLPVFVSAQQDYSADDYLKQGEEFYDRQKYDEAIEVFKKALKTQDKEKKKKAYAWIGLCYQIKQEYKEAVKYYKKASEIDESYLWVLETLGKLYLDAKIDYEEGGKYLLKAEKLATKDNEIYYNLACYYSVKKEFDKACKYR